MVAIAGLLASAAAYASIPLGGSIFPLTYISQSPTNLTDAFNEMEALISQQVVGLSTVYTGAISVPSAGTDTSGTTFSASIQGNPLVQSNFTATAPGTALNSQVTTLLVASEAGRTIYPTGVTIMVSGTAGTATGLAIECTDGRLIASWPIANLVDQLPIQGSYVSSTLTWAGAGLGKGCVAGKGIMLSDVGGTITTTTLVYTTVNYTVQ